MHGPKDYVKRRHEAPGEGVAAALTKLGRVFLEHGRVRAAVQVLEAATSAEPEDAVALATLGRARVADRDFAGGVALLRRSVGLDPTDPDAWDGLADALLAVGDVGGAEEAYREGLRVAPDEARLHSALGKLLAAQQDIPGGIDALRTAIDLGRDEATEWAELGALLFIREDLGSADRALRRALALDPNRREARHHLAMVLAQRGRKEDAVLEFQKAVDGEGASTDALVDLSVLQLSMGDAAAALAGLESALAADPGNDRAEFYRAIALCEMGNQTEGTSLLGALADVGAGLYATRAAECLARMGGRP